MQLSPVNSMQAKKTTRKRTKARDVVEVEVVPLADSGSFASCMRHAMHVSDMDQYEIADRLIPQVSHGQMSKVMKGTHGLWGERFVQYMHLTRSLAPLQWYCNQMGGVFVPFRALEG